ncbi:hypothetical protein HK104_010053 [Borealophlyctis nickersoniae]|nr:hypothetical protein HK104_010053 [Borealophlyctis nickersoniae]
MVAPPAEEPETPTQPYTTEETIVVSDFIAVPASSATQSTLLSATAGAHLPCPVINDALSKLGLLEALYYELGGNESDHEDEEVEDIDEEENVQKHQEQRYQDMRAGDHVRNLAAKMAADLHVGTDYPDYLSVHSNGITLIGSDVGATEHDDDVDGDTLAGDKMAGVDGKVYDQEHANGNDGAGEAGPVGSKKRRILERLMKPILSALDKVVEQEQKRRESVVAKIDGVWDELATLCANLGEPCESRVNETTVPPGSSVYRRLSKLRKIKAELDELLTQRKKAMTNLFDKAGVLRKEIGDLEVEEFSLASCKNYSEATMDRAARIVQDLEQEKQNRFAHLCELASTVFSLLQTLAIPPVTDHDHAIFSIFRSFSQSALPDPFDAARALTDPNNPARYILPKPLSLSRRCAKIVGERCNGIKAEYERRVGLVRGVIREIGLFWDELEVADSERRDLVEDVKLLDQYIEIAEELRVRWRVLMEEKVDRLLGELGELWDMCHVSDDEKDGFMCSLKHNLYSPVTVEMLIAEIAKLKARFERYKTLYRQIEDRNALIQKMRDFEISASDPARLFRSSFQLIEEEKFRKTCFPTLMRQEEALRRGIAGYEMETGLPFYYKKERFLEVMVSYGWLWIFQCKTYRKP